MWLSRQTPTSSGGRSPRKLIVTLLVALAAAGLAVGTVILVKALSDPEFRLRGLPDGGVLNAEAHRGYALSVTAGDAPALKEAKVSLNGEAVRTQWADGELRLLPGSLQDGEYLLRVVGDGGFLTGSRELTRSFTVDTTPPELTLADAEADSLTGPVTVEGTAKGASKVTAGGKTVKLGPDGTFSAELRTAADGIGVVATDAAGNAVEREAAVSVRRPLLRAAHVSAHGWVSDQLREPVLKLLREGKLNAVQLDVKDELGEIGYASQVPLAKKTGAAKGYYDAKQAIKEIHEAGGKVVGRIVAFRDPILARASWQEGKRDRVIQTKDGRPYGAGSNYGSLSFTNFANQDVRQYHLDLAAEAAELGFDDILYDYIRRPDGKLSNLSFPGLGDTSPEDSIVSLVRETRQLAHRHGAFLGVSVYGIATTRPHEIAQNIDKLALVSDYISPMIYPSHWNPGEYGVANPNSQPYDITQRSLADFVKQTKGSSTEIIPWIQDFSLGVSYGDKEVAAQIRAAADNGIDSFLLWNPAVRYHGGALTPIG
ncbi:putative glycoside hydrolase [Streptomyces sp. MUM 178J]|uniref:putative glycoside hydrolase n=1 Tax=Streptomyces sp. MUM 178J TaxID=2791991 RepID=UPI001F04520B|nr:putative glycoside hydrolase [Streptomyces sp. MUM 178J]WRQ81482.1 putative glycoside hydrolase [Streptomyces sp. MUM 178J]